ncbi:MAG: hypothetical protein Q7T16_01950 [Candidatus Burarchaeum sp.]|nr:hypothetical protein [Candidatus Burarchaeum sp.]MDO8339396.1 hypothetical protein [Candidatus Burarchaeum sp.]
MQQREFAVLIAALFVISFALAGCARQAEVPPEQKPAELLPPEEGPDLPPVVADCWALAGGQRDDCFATEAAQQGKADWCYLIVSNSTKESCIYGFALKTPELCADLGGDLWDDCYLNAAFTTDDKDFCALVFDAAKNAQCVEQFKGPCEDVSTVGYNRTLCEANFSRNVSKCLDGGTLESACAFEYAMIMDDGSACGAIGEESLRYACLTIFSNNSTYCESASTAEGKDLCRITVARETGDVSVCQGVVLGASGQFGYSVQGTISYIVQCYAAVGITLKNYTVCAQLASGIDRDSCYDTVARGALLPDACGQIYFLVSDGGTPIITTKHDVCYRDVAKMLSDPSVCNPIADTGTRDRFCYSPIITGRDAELKEAYNFTLAGCLAVYSPDMKWECVSELARREQNSTMCGLIPDKAEFASTKSTCLSKSNFNADVTDYRQCATLETEVEQEGCYRDVAKRFGDPSICNNIADNVTRDKFCYAQIIMGTDANGQNYTYTLEQCMKISQENRKWDCVAELAVREHYLALCDSIPASAETIISEKPQLITVGTRGLCIRKAGN